MIRRPVEKVLVIIAMKRHLNCGLGRTTPTPEYRISTTYLNLMERCTIVTRRPVCHGTTLECKWSANRRGISLDISYNVGIIFYASEKPWVEEAYHALFQCCYPLQNLIPTICAVLASPEPATYRCYDHVANGQLEHQIRPNAVFKMPTSNSLKHRITSCTSRTNSSSAAAGLRALRSPTKLAMH